MKNLLKIYVMLMVSLYTLNAFATGETMCSALTAKSKVEVYLLNSRMVGSPILDGHASIQTKTEAGDLDLNYQYKSHEMPGYWSYGSELKMLFYKEVYPENTNGIEAYSLKIEMRSDLNNTDNVEGDFELRLNDKVLDRGTVTCEFG